MSCSNSMFPDVCAAPSLPSIPTSPSLTHSRLLHHSRPQPRLLPPSVPLKPTLARFLSPSHSNTLPLPLTQTLHPPSLSFRPHVSMSLSLPPALALTFALNSPSIHHSSTHSGSHASFEHAECVRQADGRIQVSQTISPHDKRQTCIDSRQTPQPIIPQSAEAPLRTQATRQHLLQKQSTAGDHPTFEP